MNYDELKASIKTVNPKKIAENEDIFSDYYADMKKIYQLSAVNGGKVHIFSDYDADGICSALILKKIFPNAEVHINDRYKNGYSIADDIKVGKFDLIITSDIGSASKDFDTIVNYSKVTGVGAFIIDHHEIEEEIMTEYPRLLNFKSEKENRPDYCATGLAYKLYEQYYLAEDLDDIKELNTVKALACIGTVGDMVNVNNEFDDNREIIKDGFEIINNVDYDENGNLNIDEGIAYLLSDKVSDFVTSHEIAFNVVPILNAGSRVLENENGGQFVFDTLAMSPDNPEMYSRIDRMVEINDVRKADCKDIYQSEEFKKAIQTTDNVCIFISDRIKKGYTGLVAGELVKKTGKPSICLADCTHSFEGSGRNAEGYPSILDKCKVNEAISNDKYKIGGHKDAMGMTIPADRIDYFTKQVVSNYKDVVKETVEKDFFTGDMNLEQYRSLEPYGTGFPRPFVEKTITVQNKNEMGTLTNDKGQRVMAKVVSDKITYTTFADGDKFNKGDTIKVRGEICDNTYNGKTTLQVTISELENLSGREDLKLGR